MPVTVEIKHLRLVRALIENAEFDMRQTLSIGMCNDLIADHTDWHQNYIRQIVQIDAKGNVETDELGIPYTATSAPIGDNTDLTASEREAIARLENTVIVSPPANGPALVSGDEAQSQFQGRPVTITLNMRDGLDFNDVAVTIHFAANVREIIEATCHEIRQSARFQFAEVDWDEITSFVIAGTLA